MQVTINSDGSHSFPDDSSAVENKRDEVIESKAEDKDEDDGWEELEKEEDQENEAEDKEDKEEKEPETKEQKKTRYQRRINELTAKAGQAKREAEAMRAKVEAFEANQRRAEMQQQAEQLQQQAQMQRPAFEQFQNPQQYEQAMQQWMVGTQQQQAQLAMQHQQRMQHQAQQHQAASAVQQKLADASANVNYTDYNVVVNNPAVVPIGSVNPSAYQAVMDSEDFAGVSYFLAKNPAEVESFRGLNPMQVMRKVAKIEAQVSKAKSLANSAGSGIAQSTPPKEVGSGGRGRKPDPNKMSTADYMRWRRNSNSAR